VVGRLGGGGQALHPRRREARLRAQRQHPRHLRAAYGPWFTGLTKIRKLTRSLTENPYKSLKVDPDSGSTLWIPGLGSLHYRKVPQ
jgi:hypothetical protein